jgi:hypothetical protein
MWIIGIKFQPKHPAIEQFSQKWDYSGTKINFTKISPKNYPFKYTKIKGMRL